MTAPYFVEVLARNGDVLARHAAARLPIRIGRGYDNDVIIDDDHVAAQHASVELDDSGQLTLADLGSRNGVVHRGRHEARVALTGDTVVRLGHTNLRVRGTDFAVAPERADTTNHGWEGVTPGLFGLALIALSATFMVWLGDTASFQPFRYLQPIAGTMLAGLLWSGAWAFGNRLFGRHARLGRHLFIIGCGAAAITLFKIVSTLAAYAWSIESITRYASQPPILIACAVLFFHMCTVKPHQWRRFAVTFMALLVLGSGLRLMSNQQTTGRVADELYMPLLLAPVLRHSANHSVDAFFDEVRTLKADLDVERSKNVKGNTDDDED